MDAIRIGYIHACIAGDGRYSSKLEVLVDVDAKKAHVILSENGAAGGMDGPGGSTPYQEVVRMTVEAKPGTIVKAIKSTMDVTITNYGKPFKRFVWVGTPERGLSVARCQKALARLE